MKTFSGNQPHLVVGATPIGNLNEASPRLIRAFEEVKFIFCEDTRNTKKLLLLLGIKNHPTLISYHKFNEWQVLDRVINLIKKDGGMLVTDAGYPGISDPGGILIAKCHQEAIPVEVINGPSSLIHALVVSGFNGRTFYFAGFLPSQSGARKSELKKIRLLETTVIFFEAPHRILAMLNDCYEILGPQNVCVVRELTKQNEEVTIGKLGEININPVGEFVVVIENHPIPVKYDPIPRIETLLKDGRSTREIREVISGESNLSKHDVYDLILKVKEKKYA